MKIQRTKKEEGSLASRNNAYKKSLVQLRHTTTAIVDATIWYHRQQHTRVFQLACFLYRS